VGVQTKVCVGVGGSVEEGKEGRKELVVVDERKKKKRSSASYRDSTMMISRHLLGPVASSPFRSAWLRTKRDEPGNVEDRLVT